MTLTIRKVFQALDVQVRIGHGTDLPEHVADGMIYVGRCRSVGPYVRFYPTPRHAREDRPVTCAVHDRAEFRRAYRLARVARAGGVLDGAHPSSTPR